MNSAGSSPVRSGPGMGLIRAGDGLIRAAYPRGVTLTVICARRPVWKLLTSPFMLSMALGISPGVGGASSTLA